MEKLEKDCKKSEDKQFKKLIKASVANAESSEVKSRQNWDSSSLKRNDALIEAYEIAFHVNFQPMFIK